MRSTISTPCTYASIRTGQLVDCIIIIIIKFFAGIAY